jgi:hypothetical protein
MSARRVGGRGHGKEDCVHASPEHENMFVLNSSVLTDQVHRGNGEWAWPRQVVRQEAATTIARMPDKEPRLAINEAAYVGLKVSDIYGQGSHS